MSIRNKENSLEVNNPSIKFKRKKIRSKIRLWRKMLLFLGLAGVIGIFFSRIIMEIKYDKVIKQFEENEKNISDTIVNYKEIIKLVSESLVSISGSSEKLISNTYYNENSTGIILNEEGVILSNFSKIKDLENIYVKLSAKGAPPIKAELIGIDKDIDIAIIKIDCEWKLTPIKIASINDVSVGQNIAILANAIGDEYIGSINPGILTAINKKYISSKMNKEYRIIETNAPINNENTGGAVVNSKGELIGVASLDITNKNKKESLFYIVELSELKKIINSITEFKSRLGLTNGSIVRDENNEVKGFYVENVDKNGSAYKGGIKPTDIIFEIEGNSIENLDDMRNVLKDKKAGDIISCKVMRNYQIENLSIVLGE